MNERYLELASLTTEEAEAFCALIDGAQQCWCKDAEFEHKLSRRLFRQGLVSIHLDENDPKIKWIKLTGIGRIVAEAIR